MFPPRASGHPPPPAQNIRPLEPAPRTEASELANTAELQFFSSRRGSRGCGPGPLALPKKPLLLLPQLGAARGPTLSLEGSQSPSRPLRLSAAAAGRTEPWAPTSTEASGQRAVACGPFTEARAEAPAATASTWPRRQCREAGWWDVLRSQSPTRLCQGLQSMGSALACYEARAQFLHLGRAPPTLLRRAPLAFRKLRLSAGLMLLFFPAPE